MGIGIFLTPASLREFVMHEPLHPGFHSGWRFRAEAQGQVPDPKGRPSLGRGHWPAGLRVLGRQPASSALKATHSRGPFALHSMIGVKRRASPIKRWLWLGALRALPVAHRVSGDGSRSATAVTPILSTSKWVGSGLALRELERPARFGSSVLLALNDTRIAGQESVSLKHRAQIRLVMG